MIKVLSLLAAALFASVLAPVAGAAIHPGALTLAPGADTGFFAADSNMQLGLTLGLRSDSAPTTTAPVKAPKLSIAAPADVPFVPSHDFVVGSEALRSFNAQAARGQARPPADFRPEWDFIERQVAGPGIIERLGDMLDVDEQERPWATTTTVHFLAPSGGLLLPFATLAHQIDADEDFERFGLGAGAMLILDKHATLGAEVIYYGADHASSNSGFNRETQFLARLQIEY
jgi:hypothetical protein